jgi:hypothetical protein
MCSLSHFMNNDYLFITYIVTSKPKRISVAAGVVHIIILLLFIFSNRPYVVFLYLYYEPIKFVSTIVDHEWCLSKIMNQYNAY